MVGRDDIVNAVAINSATFNGARVLGPALAGLLIGAFDLSVAFFINGLSYLAVVLALVSMRVSELRPSVLLARPTTVRGVAEALGDGLSDIRRTTLVLVALVTLGLVATFGINFQVIVPPIARDVLGSDAAGFGFLLAASGVGSLLAAVWIAIRGTRPIVIGGGAIVLAVALLVLAASRSYPLSFAAMFAAGAGAIAMAATINTTMQLSVPDELRGRVMSVYTTVFAGASPLGGLLMGAIASAAGVAVAVAVGGAVSGLVGIVVAIWIIRRRPVAEAAAPPRRSAMAESARAPDPASLEREAVPSR
jgi:predicted MFS family arabinose efflux permease